MFKLPCFTEQATHGLLSSYGDRITEKANKTNKKIKWWRIVSPETVDIKNNSGQVWIIDIELLCICFLAMVISLFFAAQSKCPISMCVVMFISMLLMLLLVVCFFFCSVCFFAVALLWSLNVCTHWAIGFSAICPPTQQTSKHIYGIWHIHPEYRDFCKYMAVISTHKLIPSIRRRSYEKSQLCQFLTNAFHSELSTLL